MPLRAEWQGENVFSFDFSPDEWEKFRNTVSESGATLKMPCCGQRACLRTSPRGLQHFYHYRRGECDANAEETEEHLLLKRHLMEACRSAGFEAATEVPGDGWSADVLVELPGNTDWRVAFEVQWSHQTWEETKKRQERYEDSKVRTCWLFRHGGCVRESEEVPAFELDVPEDEERIGETKVQLWRENRAGSGDEEAGSLELDAFVETMLNGKIQWKDTCARVTKRRVVLYPYSCWNCGEETYAFYYQDYATIHCQCERIERRPSGAPLTSCLHPWDEEFEDEMLNWILRYADEHGLPIGDVKPRYSNTLDTSYLSEGCPNCDVLFGKNFLSTRSLEAGYAVDDGRLDHVIEWVVEKEKDGKQAHWCFPDMDET